MDAIQRAGETKMYNVMLVKKVDGKVFGEWITDAEGFAVEFRSLSQIDKQVAMMQRNDPSIISHTVE
jgi:hypothetical protein